MLQRIRVQIPKEQRSAIGEAVVKLEREFYGRGPSAVRVSIATGDLSVITVLSVDSLSAMDRTLAERGKVDAVVAHHQSLHDATAVDFCTAVGALVGNQPDAYLSQVDPATGYAVRVFVFTSE